MKILLCSSGECCPAVDLQDDKAVIGEEGNQVTLNKNEWNILVAKIKSGEFKSLLTSH